MRAPGGEKVNVLFRCEADCVPDCHNLENFQESPKQKDARYG